MIDMNEIAAEYRLAHWTEVVRERENSGLSIREYCERADFPANRYFYWQKKLRKAAYEELTKEQCDSATSLTPVFAEVRLPMRSAIPTSNCTQQSDIMIESSGVRITASREYPVEQLAELLNTVMRSCC